MLTLTDDKLLKFVLIWGKVVLRLFGEKSWVVPEPFLSYYFFVKEMLLIDGTMDDFLLADIWGLGMIFFSMINPSVKYPYRLEIRSAGNVSSQEQLKIFISSLLREKKLPLLDEKYGVERATIWRGLEEIYRECVNFDRHSRLSLEEAVAILSRDNKRVSEDLDVLHLKVSQATAV